MSDKTVEICEELSHDIINMIEERLENLSPGFRADQEHSYIDDDDVTHIIHEGGKSYILDDHSFYEIKEEAIPQEPCHVGTVLHGMPYWTMMEEIRDMLLEKFELRSRT